MLRHLGLCISILCVVLLAGCAEVVRGPRVVDYSERHFYVRHSPMTSTQTIEELASVRCDGMGMTPRLLRSAQYYPFDLRYATYDCVAKLSERHSRESPVSE